MSQLAAVEAQLALEVEQRHVAHQQLANLQVGATHQHITERTQPSTQLTRMSAGAPELASGNETTALHTDQLVSVQCLMRSHVCTLPEIAASITGKGHLIVKVVVAGGSPAQHSAGPGLAHAAHGSGNDARRLCSPVCLQGSLSKRGRCCQL